jgi:two-component system invasion response regulator UvrY
MTPDREPARAPPGPAAAVGVLTVDDQQVFRSAAREVIEATPGFRSVGEASCGEEAIGLVDEREPELVLVDVRMPGMDGIETTKRIKEAHPGMVVVLISIENHPNVPAAAADAGAAELVSKQDFGSRLLRRLWSVHGAQT